MAAPTLLVLLVARALGAPMSAQAPSQEDYPAPASKMQGIEVKWDDSAPYEEDPDYREEEIEEILANSDMTAGELVGLMEDRLSSEVEYAVEAEGQQYVISFHVNSSPAEETDLENLEEYDYSSIESDEDSLDG